jgi:hypothetical protein
MKRRKLCVWKKDAPEYCEGLQNVSLTFICAIKASAYGLQKDLNLKGGQYGWLGSIFYFGYLVAQLPAGYAMQRLPVGKFLGFTGVSWGIILMTTPACTSSQPLHVGPGRSCRQPWIRVGHVDVVHREGATSASGNLLLHQRYRHYVWWIAGIRHRSHLRRDCEVDVCFYYLRSYVSCSRNRNSVVPPGSAFDGKILEPTRKGCCD